MENAPTVPDPNVLRERTITGVGWTAVAQTGRQVSQFVVSVILARLLTPEDFGLVAMIVVFTGFATLFGEMGFSAALVQRQKPEERHYSSIFWLSLLAGLVLAGVVVAVAPAVAKFYDEARLTSLTVLLALNFPISSLSLVQRAVLMRAMAFRRLTLVDVVAVASGGALAIALAKMGYGVWSLVWQMLAVSSITAAVLWWVAGWRPALLFDRSGVADLLPFSSNLLGSNIFTYWARNSDNMLVGRFIGSEGLGIYARGYSTMLLPLSQITSVLTRVMFPALSRIQDDKPRVKRIYLRAVAMIALVTFPMMMGLLVVADHFVGAIYGPRWTGVTGPLRILCVVGMIQSIVSTVGWIYQSQGRTDLMFKWGLFSGCIAIVSFLIGVYFGTVEAVAWCYALANGVLLYWNFAIPGRLIHTSFFQVIRSVSGIFLCAIMMAALVCGVGRILPQDWPHWAPLTVQVSTGVLVYLVLVHLFRVRAYQDLRKLVLEQCGSYREQRKLGGSPLGW